jgi:hypothetical protein
VNLSHLSHLEELWASNCQIGDFAEVERELKGKEELTTVYFEGNPLQLKGAAVYRNKIRLALPQLRQIDASRSFPSDPPNERPRLTQYHSICESLVTTTIETYRASMFDAPMSALRELRRAGPQAGEYRIQSTPLLRGAS